MHRGDGMNYIWEAALAADRAGTEREAVRFISVRNGSPYAEVVLENINSLELERPEVEVNPLYRFSREFSGVFDINNEGYQKTRELFFLMWRCTIWCNWICVRGFQNKSMPCVFY